jgi:hypothetical protein
VWGLKRRNVDQQSEGLYGDAASSAAADVLSDGLVSSLQVSSLDLEYQAFAEQQAELGDDGAAAPLFSVPLQQRDSRTSYAYAGSQGDSESAARKRTLGKDESDGEEEDEDAWVAGRKCARGRDENDRGEED